VLMLSIGFFLMRSPTLLLGFLLVAPYELFVAARRVGARGVEYGAVRLVGAICLGVAMLAAFVAVGLTFFAERLDSMLHGLGISSFCRQLGPIRVAEAVIGQYPIAGAGLTAEEFVRETVLQIYASSPEMPARWTVDKIAAVLSNYFWLHWIYLGIVFG